MHEGVANGCPRAWMGDFLRSSQIERVPAEICLWRFGRSIDHVNHVDDQPNQPSGIFLELRILHQGL